MDTSQKISLKRKYCCVFVFCVLCASVLKHVCGGGDLGKEETQDGMW